MKIAYPTDGSLGFLFRNTHANQESLLVLVKDIPSGYAELTVEKWGGELPKIDSNEVES